MAGLLRTPAHMGRYIAGARVLLCGASYREDVGDTRYAARSWWCASSPRWAQR